MNVCVALCDLWLCAGTINRKRETLGSRRMFLTLTFTVEQAIQKVPLAKRNHTGVVWGEPF